MSHLLPQFAKVSHMTDTTAEYAETAGMPPLSVPLRLKIARTAAGMTQRDLARVLEISRQTIGNLENGVEIPRRVNLLAWAVATGSDPRFVDPTYVPRAKNPYIAPETSVSGATSEDVAPDQNLYTPRDSNPEPIDSVAKQSKPTSHKKDDAGKTDEVAA